MLLKTLALLALSQVTIVKAQEEVSAKLDIQSILDHIESDLDKEQLKGFGMNEELCKGVWLSSETPDTYGKCLTYINPAMNRLKPIEYASDCPGGCAINDFCVQKGDLENEALCDKYAPGMELMLLLIMVFSVFWCLIVAQM